MSALDASSSRNVPSPPGGGFPYLLGDHPAIVAVQQLIARVAATDATVLLSGESGTGKELAARGLHALSARSIRSFVSVNCGAIPAPLLESELFGHERGAFTDATAARAGLFQIADGGTIFLDEIGEMDPTLQIKLLRVLEDREIRPIGSERSRRVDVRIVAATNADLVHAVARGRFREDLFYRLQVVPVEMPPLRARRSDIPSLVAHFLRVYAHRRPQGPLRIGHEAMASLLEYEWPGNVRELANLIERLTVLVDDPVVRVRDLPPEVCVLISERRLPQPVLPDEGLDLNEVVVDFERDLIAQALRRTRGNKQAAARLLGVGRTTLIAKLRRARVAHPLHLRAVG